MHNLIYWTGALVWLLIACAPLLLAYELGKGLCIAVDWLRWVMAARRSIVALGNQAPPWRTLPAAFLRRWWDFTLSPAGFHFYSPYGCWMGFRKWTVYPPGDVKDQRDLLRQVGL